MAKRPRDEKGKFIAAEPVAEIKVVKMVKVAKKGTVAEVPVKVVAEALPQCKSCGNNLIKILFDSRAEKPLYLYLCNNPDCPLYRQPQESAGDKPRNINIIMA